MRYQAMCTFCERLTSCGSSCGCRSPISESSTICLSPYAMGTNIDALLDDLLSDDEVCTMCSPIGLCWLDTKTFLAE